MEKHFNSHDIYELLIDSDRVSLNSEKKVENKLIKIKKRQGSKQKHNIVKLF